MRFTAPSRPLPAHLLMPGAPRRRSGRPAGWTPAALATLLVAGLLAAGPRAQAQAPAAPAASASPGSAPAPARAIRADVGMPLQAAQALIAEGKGSEALAKVAEAAAVPALTPWETWLVERMRASAAQRVGDTALVMRALEAALATGQAEVTEEIPLVEVLVGLASREKDHARVLRWAQRYDEIKGPNDSVRLIRIQSMVDRGDEAGARKALQERADAAERAGTPAPENQLRLLLSLQRSAKDSGEARTLERLAATYPRPEYWADVVATAARQPNLNDRTLLPLYRLLRATGNLRQADLRFEMAQAAQRAGQPGEALMLLEEGFTSGQLGSGARAPDHQKLREQLRRQAAADKADRPAAEAAARRASDGSALADLGWSVVAAADPQAGASGVEPGLALIEQGVAKGGLKRPLETRLQLGIAQLAAGRKEAAAKTLDEAAAQAGSDALAAPIRLWSMWAKVPAMLPSRQ